MAEEFAQRLSDKFHVSLETAQAALDAAGGDLLDAAEALEGENPPETRQVGFYSTAAPPPQEPPLPVGKPAPAPGQAWDKIWQTARGIFQRPAANCLEVAYPGGAFQIPALILILLLCVAFWISLGLLALAWVTGCRFALRGPDIAFPQANQALDFVCDKMADWKERAKIRHK